MAGILTKPSASLENVFLKIKKTCIVFYEINPISGDETFASN